MHYNIPITKTTNSKLSDIDFDNIPFGATFSDHMFMADYIDGEWTNLKIVPFGNFEISPVNLALHYGQSIFEGMKASKMENGKPAFFRPEMHIKRLNASARRMMMAEFPEDLFLQSLHELVALDSNWIPPKEGSALYIRPFMFATGEKLGVSVSETYKYIVVTGPVGPYYPKPVKLLAEDKYVRAAEGGVGEAKTAGNYAASLLPAAEARKKGYDQVMWLDSKEFKYIQEVGTMNIFMVIGDKVITPPTNGAILKGITRDTLIQVLESKGYTVEEKEVSIDELAAAYDAGELKEMFGTGTAAVVANVAEVKYKDKVMVLPPAEDQTIANMLRDEINQMRSGKIEDTFNWIVPVKATVSV